MKIGFVGSTSNMPEKQCMSLVTILKEMFEKRKHKNKTPEFHHRGLFGSDSQAHMLARSFGWESHLHSNVGGKFDANLKASTVHQHKTLVEACAEIIKQVDILVIATTTDTMPKSGYWASMDKLARIKGKESLMKILIIKTDGSMKLTICTGELDDIEMEFS